MLVNRRLSPQRDEWSSRRVLALLLANVGVQGQRAEDDGCGNEERNQNGERPPGQRLALRATPRGGEEVTQGRIGRRIARERVEGGAQPRTAHEVGGIAAGVLPVEEIAVELCARDQPL